MKTYQYFTLLSVILSAVCFGSIVDIDRRGEAYLLFAAFGMSALACIVAFLQRNDKSMSTTVYFQPPGIKKGFCEAGMVPDSDPDYVWYYNEPCKVLLANVKIIPAQKVSYDKKQGVYMVKQGEL